MRCSFCGAFQSQADRAVCTTHSEPDAVLIMSSLQQTIFSIEDWFRICPPKKRETHWKDGFSAKECAKAWFRNGRPTLPEELRTLWRSSPDFADLDIATVHPELATRLDEYRGPRSADVVLLGVARGRTTLVSIEAKAGEDFGPVIGPYLEQCINGNVPDRIERLSNAVFNRPIVRYDPELVTLRYQLLHALVGTAIEAHQRGAEQAAMVVHFFPNDNRPMDDSFEDFQVFVRAASQGRVPAIAPNQLVELTLPGGGFVPFGARVSVGWAVAPQ
jgi:hypothetical protein